jgi:hypothetical protein
MAMNIVERARGFVDRTLAQARPYRFEGEQENHADLLRERRVSLSMMEAADPENPDQIRMASEIEHDAEARLTVLLGKPRLTLEEKRERDAIQAAIQGRRQGFGDAPPVLVPRQGGVGPRRFLGAVAGVQLWHALAVGWAVTFGLLGVQSARVASLKGNEREMRQELREAANTIDHYQQREAQYDAALESAREQATETADALERERTRAARAAAAERRRQREIQDVLANSPEPPAWSLRDNEPGTD